MCWSWDWLSDTKCKKKNTIVNGLFVDPIPSITERGWQVAIQTGSDPSANWYQLTSNQTPVNNFFVPFPAQGGYPYALFENKRGTPASGVLYQLVTPSADKPILTFNWYAIDASSLTSRIERPSMDVALTPNFQFRLDVMRRNLFFPTFDTGVFTNPSETGVLQNLIEPVVSGTAQVSLPTLETVITGFNRARFDLSRFVDKKVVLAFRVASVSPFQGQTDDLKDALFVGVSNVVMIAKSEDCHSKKTERDLIYNSGFFFPQNASDTP